MGFQVAYQKPNLIVLSGSLQLLAVDYDLAVSGQKISKARGGSFRPITPINVTQV